VKRIERIYIATHRGDMRFTRICVASIRRWYPEIPLYLIKDMVNGPFSTSEVEERWNARVWPTKDRVFGWGFAKLEPLFESQRVRYLMLDSDIVFLGRVIDALERFDEDFVVQEEVQPKSKVVDLYFDPAALKARVNPQFRGPAFTFNTGQYVATSGMLARADFATLVDWTTPRRVRMPEVFNPSEQGVLNYVLLQAQTTGAVTIARTPFMKWGAEEVRDIEVSLLKDGSPYPYLIHWAGLKAPRLRHMMRADILRHFEDGYYKHVPGGRLLFYARALADEAWGWRTRATRRLRWLANRMGLARSLAGAKN
jgi:hypothetical protein